MKIVLWLAVGCALVVFLLPPIPQPASYHEFAGPRWHLVASNLPLFVVGVVGFFRTVGVARAIFAALILTSFGSAYYHLEPNDARLVWDRVPIALMAMSLLAYVVGERWLLPLLFAGGLSVVHWYATNDLRFYGFVQFFPLIAVLVQFPRDVRWWSVLGWFFVAKACEVLDVPIHALTGVVSGHALKHLFAAGAAWAMVRALERRRLAGTP